MSWHLVKLTNLKSSRGGAIRRPISRSIPGFQSFEPCHKNFAYAESKAQISCASSAAQLISIFVFATQDCTVTILSKSEISRLKPSSVVVQPGLCRTLSETAKTGFLTTRLFFHAISATHNTHSHQLAI